MAPPDDDEAPSVPKRRRRRDWDAYAAVIASLIGLLALAVSGYTAYLQRQQVKAMVWPSLTLGRAMFKYHQFIVGNDGMGPARIKAVRVEVKGKVVHDWREAFVVAGLSRDERYVHSTINGRVLPPNAKIEIFEAVEGDQGKKVYDVIFDEVPLGIAICYCSVLDECWLANYGRRAFGSMNEHTPDRCPIAEADQFRQ